MLYAIEIPELYGLTLGDTEFASTQAAWEANGCAPLIVAGPALEAARGVLAARPLRGGTVSHTSSAVRI